MKYLIFIMRYLYQLNIHIFFDIELDKSSQDMFIFFIVVQRFMRRRNLPFQQHYGPCTKNISHNINATHVNRTETEQQLTGPFLLAYILHLQQGLALYLYILSFLFVYLILPLFFPSGQEGIKLINVSCPFYIVLYILYKV